MQKKIEYKFLLENYSEFIFDFDGIIKESVEIKSNAYLELFKNKGSGLSKIKNHLTSNVGMSRYEKIPLYMKYCGIEIKKDLISKYSNDFSNLVNELVLNSNWVPGFLSFFNKLNCYKKKIYIVSATPQNEIKRIVKKLKLNFKVDNIYGSPQKKTTLLNSFVDISQIEKYIFFGDSQTDSEAASNLSMDFAYRSYALNYFNKPLYYSYIFSDFNDFFD